MAPGGIYVFFDVSRTVASGSLAGMRILLVLAIALGLTTGSANDTTDPAQSAAEPYVAKGRVTDAAGNPLPNVDVFADNTVLYDMNVYGVSDADGAYRIELGDVTPSSWRVGAYLEIDYKGVDLLLPLHPSNDQPFAGIGGAVVDLTWLMTGATPTGGTYGSPVYVYEDMDATTWIDDLDLVELTFEPLAPLLDGTTGETIVRLLASGQVDDVAVTEYAVSARYLTPQGDPVDLLLRVRGGGVFGTAVHADFVDDGYGNLHMELEIRLP